jgi:hypothetical protein
VVALQSGYRQVTGVVSRLSPRDFLRPTLTDDWCVSDVLFHLLLDAQRALVTFATPSAAVPDVDAVTYWCLRSDADSVDGAAHARYVRLSAAAYRSPAGLVQQWTDTSEAALRAACAADLAGSVATQGHELTVADFVGTLVVEATIHYLDLTAHLPAAAPADPVGLIVVRHTMEALLQAPLPSSWSDLKCALVGSGRQFLEASDRQELGDAAGRFPLIR